MEISELLSKLDLIEENARCTLEEFPHLTKERQRIILALVYQIKAAHDPEITVIAPDARVAAR